MKTTETLSAINESRATTPEKYIWGTFTPDKEGVGYTELPSQTTVGEIANLVVDDGTGKLVTISVADFRVLMIGTLENELAKILGV